MIIKLLGNLKNILKIKSKKPIEIIEDITPQVTNTVKKAAKKPGRPKGSTSKTSSVKPKKKAIE